MFSFELCSSRCWHPGNSAHCGFSSLNLPGVCHLWGSLTVFSVTAWKQEVVIASHSLSLSGYCLLVFPPDVCWELREELGFLLLCQDLLFLLLPWLLLVCPIFQPLLLAFLPGTYGTPALLRGPGYSTQGCQRGISHMRKRKDNGSFMWVKAKQIPF